ncbi:carbohydrate kinase family protein [Streptomyces sp. IMTB 2501]|uniref:carbohydrate kinase family protein n=1 Tax=Streptomyces sp. IMTB 2501 TaxID=1776340 RepID=UPI00096C8E5C|nr:carbohydrate kinase family protein [Streptomyces sp. IMTB 2501]OLZ67836.1 carbohydrate kinase family protein [Streptomyces sp. IMTB 2501]
MRIAVTGSIATDHLMQFPGRFTDQLIADRLDTVSLSFLVDHLEVRRGGVAANIAFGLGRLGLSPLLVGAVGSDFGPYRAWLEENGVDTGCVHVSGTAQTARFMCTTDLDQNQIASFYAGAMAEADRISLRAVAETAGGLDLVVISPNAPEAMVRHTEEARELAVPFLADPSQQLPRLSPEQIRSLVDGARYLFTNEYEAALLLERTGWSEAEVLDRVGAWVTTLGPLGARIQRLGAPTVTVDAVPAEAVADPTGIGDAFRAGFLAAVSRGLGDEDAARLGSACATLVLEAVGSQDLSLGPAAVIDRLRRAYGEQVAARPVERMAVAV